jgi:proline-specific peptidase
MAEIIQTEELKLNFEYATIWCQKWFTESTKDKAPLIFVHGGPGFESGYIISLKALATQRPCIFYDQSGCGKSIIHPNASIKWSFEHYATELALLIDMLGIRTCILFGYSWGSTLALNYTCNNPQRIEKLILASPYISTPHLVANYKQLAQSKNIYNTIVTHETAETTDSADYQQALWIFFSNFVFRGNLARFNSLTLNKEISEIMWGKYEFTVTGNLKELNLIPLLQRIRVPVLFTSGRYDTMTPEYMELLQSKTFNSNLIIFEESAHMPHIEEEHLYIEVLKSFIS